MAMKPLGMHSIDSLNETMPRSAIYTIMSTSGNKTAHRKPDGCVRVGKCVYKALAREESADIYKRKHAHDYEQNNRENKVDNLSSRARLCFLRLRTVAARIQIALFGSVVFVKPHRTVIKLHEGNCDDEHEGEKRIEVIGYCADEKRKPVAALDVSRNGSRPDEIGAIMQTVQPLRR